MDWSDGTIARLRELWDETNAAGAHHSTGTIARMLGTTKNAVVGKAHRLDLPARQSPIIRDGREPKRRPPPRPTRTLPSLADPNLPHPPAGNGEGHAVPAERPAGSRRDPSEDASRMAPDAAKVAVGGSPTPSVPDPAPVVAAPPPPPPPPPVIVAPPRPYEKKPCCWPIGEPGRKGFRFCDDEAVRGKPYCAEHCAAAYPSAKVREALDARISTTAIKMDDRDYRARRSVV